MIAKIQTFVKGLGDWAKTHLDTVLIVIVTALFVLSSFALGYILAKYQDRAPIIINQPS